MISNKRLFYSFLWLFLLTIGLTTSVNAQKLNYETNKKTGLLRQLKRNGKSVLELVRGVKYTQNETIIYCDSSLFYKKKKFFEAYGNVKIQDGDSVTITAETLIYDGKEGKATLTGDVVYISGDKRLYTDKLDYNLITKVSYFNTGGRLIDEQNDLTSKIGYYDSKIDLATFYDSVHLKAETFILVTDTLKYYTVPKTAYTQGPTIITTNSGNIIRNIGGKYETVREKMNLEEGKVETEDYFLEGDTIIIDDYIQFYKAIGNVKLTAKNNDVIITGKEGYYDRASGFSKVYGKPVMKKIMAVDTFYMSADTLVAIEAEIDSAKRILGYKDVRIFKDNMQGITDSISYFLSDSIIYLYEDPVLWTNKNQISGDTISLLIKDKYVEKMNLYRNSFMVSEDTLGNYNQVKGRNMIANFNMNDIIDIKVLGNGESLYFALSKEEDVLIGMNKVTCSNLTLLFTTNELSDIYFYKKPESTFTPPHEFSASSAKLPGFAWRANEKPTLSYVVNRPAKIESAKNETEETPDSTKTDKPGKTKGKPKNIETIKEFQSEEQ